MRGIRSHDACNERYMNQTVRVDRGNQAYFFRGQYRKAMMEFVFAEGEYYPDVQPWIEAALDRMAGAR